MRRHNAVARFMEHWYAERYQAQCAEGVEVDERAVMHVGGDIEVGHEPKLTAQLVEVPREP